MEYYRFIADGKGIYEVVDQDCPKGDQRRLNKPDGSWLPKKGLDYPGAISFWTDFGIKRYFDSGLLNWHTSVVKGNIEVMIIEELEDVLYEDEYQIILKSEQLKIKDRMVVDKFLEKMNLVPL